LLGKRARQILKKGYLAKRELILARTIDFNAFKKRKYVLKIMMKKAFYKKAL
jgi:hypothetical protein